jgi:hypothetical protein
VHYLEITLFIAVANLFTASPYMPRILSLLFVVQQFTMLPIYPVPIAISIIYFRSQLRHSALAITLNIMDI